MLAGNMARPGDFFEPEFRIPSVRRRSTAPRSGVQKVRNGWPPPNPDGVGEVMMCLPLSYFQLIPARHFNSVFRRQPIIDEIMSI